LGRDVALKISPTDPAIPDAIARFVREAKIIAKFDHPNIVSVIDAGDLPGEGYVFLVMELLRGRPFSDRLVPGVRLSPREVVPIVIDVCRGLEVAHAARIVHRDIKPENIFLAAREDGTIVPKILDFGISCTSDRSRADRITVAGQILGTPAYMSPEQAR